MQLYYGADKIVQEPLYNFGNPSNDYGLGFYMTPDIEMARLWAGKNTGGGYCMTYEVDLGGLHVLRLDDATSESTLAWIGLLVQHRFSREEYEAHRQSIDWLAENCAPDLSQADAVVGYRADDSYFAYSRDFVANELSIETLMEAMHLGKLGLQYVLKSRKAFSQSVIRMLRYERVEHTDEYGIFRRSTLSQYRALKSTDDIGNTFIRDIMRERRPRP